MNSLRILKFLVATDGEADEHMNVVFELCMAKRQSYIEGLKVEARLVELMDT